MIGTLTTGGHDHDDEAWLLTFFLIVLVVLLIAFAGFRYKKYLRDKKKQGILMEDYDEIQGYQRLEI